MPFLSTAWLTGYLAANSVQRIFSRFSHHLPELERTCYPGIRSLNQMHTNNALIKPPNILVYTGIGDEERKYFELVKNKLSQILNRNSYVIYQVNNNQILQHPWAKNSVLLVIPKYQAIEKPVLRQFKHYLDNGGRVLNFCCGSRQNGEDLLQDVIVKPLDLKSRRQCSVDIRADRLDIQINRMDISCEPFFFEGKTDNFDVLATEKGSGQPVIVYTWKDQSKTVLSIIDLLTPNEDDNKRQLLQAILKKLGMKCVSQQIPCVTPGYLFGSEQNIHQLKESLAPYLTNGICKGKQASLLFCDTNTTSNIPTATEEMLPVLTEHDSECKFEWTTYKQHLNTHTLGKLVIYTDVIPSTQTLLEGNFTLVQNVPAQIGIVAVTRQQVKGKGRSGNAWLSPIGCMMFSMLVRVKFGTELGSRLPYLQHIASLALVEAIRSLEGYQDINICLKWPNDLYFGRNVKIGGVVVSSTAYGNEFTAVIGMGVNVSNKEPTVCINDIIRQYNDEHGTNLPELCIAMLLARTITCMENLITDFQKHGKEGFLKKYYRWWLHSGCQVTLNTSDNPQQVTITGLDDFGFLLVQKENGENLSVQPDGNTFDILANLIEIK